VAARRQHDENQIYGCLMVPVDRYRVHVPEVDPKVQVERKARRSSWRGDSSPGRLSVTRSLSPRRRVSAFARIALTTLAMVGSALVVLAVASASAPVDIADGGDDHESVGQEDMKTKLLRGVTYEATKFPLAVRVRAPDALWNGVQLHSKRFSFVQFLHLKAGNVPLHGWGWMTLEASTGPTGSVAETAQQLHATPGLKAAPLKAVRVAGFRGKKFDATVVGTESGDNGVALTPFTAPLRCGWCTRTMHGETLDNKFAGEGELFQIIVIGVRGTTVVIYLESSRADSSTRNHPPTETFPTFLPYAQKLLSTLTFPR
jgi:hypothetical protein